MNLLYACFFWCNANGVLDVAGFIPGMGAFAIPGIGDTVALAKKSVNAIKGGLKSLKGIKNINALKKANGIKKALTGMCGKAKTGASRLKKGKECIYETNCERRQEMLQGGQENV